MDSDDTIENVDLIYPNSHTSISEVNANLNFNGDAATNSHFIAAIDELDVTNFVEKLRLPCNYEYRFAYTDQYEAVIRAKDINNEAAVKLWLEEYSKESQTEWRTKRTYPYSGRKNVFKLDLICRKYTEKDTVGARRLKTTNCVAVLKIIVKRVVKNPRGKPDAFLFDFPTIIKFIGNHNHAVNTGAPLKLRPMSDSVKEKLTALFQKGYTATSALKSHQMDLMLEYGDRYGEIENDGKFMPTISKVNHLFIKLAESALEMSDIVMIADLKIALEEFEKETHSIGDAVITSDGNHYFVVICTAMMLRCHEKIPECSELVLLETLSEVGCGRKFHVYFFITHCGIGTFPLGVIITDSNKQTVFDEALSHFIAILPSSSFYFTNSPTVFLVGQDLKEMEALEEVFQDSTCFINQFHLLKTVWNWLCLSFRKIPRDHRKELYFLFKVVVNSSSEEEGYNNFQSLVDFANKNGYRAFLSYVSKIMEHKKKFMHCFQSKLSMCINNTTGHITATFQILKNHISKIVASFDLIQLCDYIRSRYEPYMRQRMIELYRETSCSPLAKILPCAINERDFIIKKTLFEGYYEVFTRSPSVRLKVDAFGEMCTCAKSERKKGARSICAHILAVILLKEKNLQINKSSYKMVNDMRYIVTGKLQGTPEAQYHDEFAEIADTCEGTFPETVTKEILPKNTNKNVEHANFKTKAEKAHLRRSQVFSVEDDKLLQNLFNRITQGLQNEATGFVPAVKIMLENVSEHCTTDAGLVSAMCSFGTYSSAPHRLKLKTVMNQNKIM